MVGVMDRGSAEVLLIFVALRPDIVSARAKHVISPLCVPQQTPHGCSFKVMPLNHPPKITCSSEKPRKHRVVSTRLSRLYTLQLCEYFPRFSGSRRAAETLIRTVVLAHTHKYKYEYKSRQYHRLIVVVGFAPLNASREGDLAGAA